MYKPSELKELVAFVEEQRDAFGSIVFTNGCFDVLHAGHLCLLQTAAAIANSGRSVIYVSGEEAIAQVGMRANRLGLDKAPVRLASETNLRNILDTLEKSAPADVLVIDSIQTMWSDALDSAPGTVAQVRACSQELVRFAKRRNTCVILVGHVTKEVISCKI